jgi:hypothetical protein
MENSVRCTTSINININMEDLQGGLLGCSSRANTGQLPKHQTVRLGYEGG